VRCMLNIARCRCYRLPPATARPRAARRGRVQRGRDKLHVAARAVWASVIVRKNEFRLRTKRTLIKRVLKCLRDAHVVKTRVSGLECSTDRVDGLLEPCEVA